MNPFTYAHSFVSPGFYKPNIAMCQKLLNSADHSLRTNTSCWQV